MLHILGAHILAHNAVQSGEKRRQLFNVINRSNGERVSLNELCASSVSYTNKIRKSVHVISVLYVYTPCQKQHNLLILSNASDKKQDAC